MMPPQGARLRILAPSEHRHSSFIDGADAFALHENLFALI